MFGWLRTRRRRRLAETPFPPAWRAIVDRLPTCAVLSEDERETLHGIVRILMAEKRFEGCGGLVLDEAMRVGIAARSAVLLLAHDDPGWPDVSSILVYPSTFVKPGRAHPVSQLHDVGPRDGEAWPHGPVILAWDRFVRECERPEEGRDVVLHEFAHRLDMENGDADGVPPLLHRVGRETWRSTLRAEFEALKRDADRGAPTLLDPYGATNPAEFFAVATEVFFTRPRELRARHGSLYAALHDWYGQDPAERREPVGARWLGAPRT